MNLEERLARLDKAVSYNTVKRGQWTACLLSQLSPEAEDANNAGACPSDVMPAWLAYLTPWIDDSGTVEHWPDVVRRYASLARRWHALVPEQWHRLDYRVRAICVREATRHTTDQKVIETCAKVALLCDRVANGGDVTSKEWAVAAARAAGAAAWAARAAAGTAEARAARAEAEAAAGAGAAAWAARAAWAAKAARAEAGTAEAAGAAGADRIIDAVLDAIEQEVSK
jgi:membrane protease subunit (stomatin/prohibitin family)